MARLNSFTKEIDPSTDYTENNLCNLRMCCHELVPWIASVLATRRLRVSGTRRSAKPAMNDQIMSSANDTPSFGPVSLRKSFTCSTRAVGVSLGVGVGVGEALGLAAAVCVAAAA